MDGIMAQKTDSTTLAQAEGQEIGAAAEQTALEQSQPAVP